MIRYYLLFSIRRIRMIINTLYPNGTVYLSGGMQFSADQGTGWRAVCGEQLIQLGFNPIDIAAMDIAYSDAHGQLYRFMTDEELLQRKSNIRKHFIDAD